MPVSSNVKAQSALWSLAIAIRFPEHGPFDPLELEFCCTRAQFIEAVFSCCSTREESIISLNSGQFPQIGRPCSVTRLFVRAVCTRSPHSGVNYLALIFSPHLFWESNSRSPVLQIPPLLSTGGGNHCIYFLIHLGVCIRGSGQVRSGTALYLL